MPFNVVDLTGTERAPRSSHAPRVLIDSHDTNRAVHVLNEKGFTGSGYDRQPVDGFADARKRLGMVAALQMTLPGAPTIYYGDEVGLTGYGSDVNRDDPYTLAGLFQSVQVLPFRPTIGTL